MGYYAGDPGFLSSIGKIFGGVASFIPGVGGIVSKIASSAIGQGAKKAGTAVVKTIAQHPVLTAAGGAAVAGVGAAETARMHMPGFGGGGGGMARGRYAPPGTRGYHPQKHPGRHSPNPTMWVRNRRMRSTNPRALRRALRRAKSFEHLARRVIHLTSPRSRGRVAFKFRRKRRA